MHNEKYAIWSIFMAESPKFLHHIGNQGRRTRWWRQILTESRNKTVLRMRNKNYAIWPLVMAELPKLLHSSAMDLWTRLWGRYHVPQNVFLVFECRRRCCVQRTGAKVNVYLTVITIKQTGQQMRHNMHIMTQIFNAFPITQIVYTVCHVCARDCFHYL